MRFVMPLPLEKCISMSGVESRQLLSREGDRAAKKERRKSRNRKPFKKAYEEFMGVIRLKAINHD